MNKPVGVGQGCYKKAYALLAAGWCLSLRNKILSYTKFSQKKNLRYNNLSLPNPQTGWLFKLTQHSWKGLSDTDIICPNSRIIVFPDLQKPYVIDYRCIVI